MRAQAAQPVALAPRRALRRDHEHVVARVLEHLAGRLSAEAWKAVVSCGRTMPTAIVDPRRSERARWLGSNASRRAAAHTRARVGSDTFGLAASARDAVARETPAVAATSASVGRVRGRPRSYS